MNMIEHEWAGRREQRESKLIQGACKRAYTATRRWIMNVHPGFNLYSTFLPHQSTSHTHTHTHTHIHTHTHCTRSVTVPVFCEMNNVYAFVTPAYPPSFLNSCPLHVADVFLVPTLRQAVWVIMISWGIINNKKLKPNFKMRREVG